MSVILVAEEDAGSAEQIANLLQSEGWLIEIVPSRNDALRVAAARRPALLLASVTLPEASGLLAAFSRRRGGPGSVALVAQAAAGATAEDYQADDLVTKPCSAEALVRTVRHYLTSSPPGAGARPAGAAGSGPQPARVAGPPAAGPPPTEPRGGQQLTSADIFGDVLAEVEAEAQREKTARRARARTRRSQTEDLERRLEETLSGVISVDGQRKHAGEAGAKGAVTEPPPAGGGSAAAAAATGTPDGPRPPKRSKPPTANEIDDLLDKTLSSLDLSSRSKRPKTSSARPAAGPKPPAAPELPPVRRAAAPPPVAPAPEPPPAARPEATPPVAPAAGDPTPSPAPDAAPASPARDAAAPVFDPPPVVAGPQAVPPVTAGSAPALAALPGQSFQTQRLPVVPIDPELAADAAGEAAYLTADRRAGGRRLADRRIADRWEAADGRTFGEYTLIERVAIGGMAEVWRARRRGVEGFQKTVAIKKILAHLIDSPDFVNMFIDEAKLAAQLNHHNIIQIYDLGKVGDDFFIAMEYVDGKDLRSILNAAQETGQPPPLGLALLIASALARALDYAHRKRDFDNRELALVHRDVSPQNVLISYEGEIKLCDFGIVKAVSKASTTQMGALKGKLQYMSPEQAWGRSVDARSDIFSLGSVLFEILTGTKLFAGDSELGVLDAVRECRIRSPREIVPAIPESVERIVFKALNKSPEGRYQTAGEMEHDLKSELDGIKPTPSLKDLGAYLDSLFHPSATDAPPPAAVTGSGISEAVTATPTPEREPTPEPEAWKTPTPEPEAWKAPDPEPEAWKVTEPEAWPADVQEAPLAAAPAAAGTPDRGAPDRGTPDRRGGKRFLAVAAAAVLAIVLAGAGWWMFLRPDPTGTPNRDPSDRGAPAREETAAPPSTALPAAPGAGEPRPGASPSGALAAEVTPETAAPEATGSTPGGDAAAGPFPADLEELVAEEVLKRREQMERDFEEKKRRLEEEIEKAKEVTEPPPAPAAEPEEPAGSGGGNGSS